MSGAPVLVAGATGDLGRQVAHLLLDVGTPVRVWSRSASRLDEFVVRGAETVVGDMRDAAVAARACDGVGTVVSTANNVVGTGASSPLRVDLPAYRTLCAATKAAGVQRHIHVSARGIAADSPVDYFRVKAAVDRVVQASGVPWVLVQPTAFIETWVVRIIGDPIRTKGTATLFGDGKRPINFVATGDVARTIACVAGDAGIRDEVIGVGGPSTLSMEEVARLVEAALGITARRVRVPVPVLRWAPLLVRPFNEVLARQVRFGYFAATADQRFDDWARTAQRFGLEFTDVPSFVARHFTAA